VREWDRTYRRVGVAEFTQVHGDQHALVVNAIAAGDGPAAHRAMAHHLEALSIDMGVALPGCGRRAP
jgi:DNA-binding GntR family transcriptional regulator